MSGRIAAGGRSEMSYRCPHCQAVVLSRRNPRCATCQRPLPPEIAFTAARVREIEAEEREREQARRDRDEQRARERANHQAGGDGGGGGIGFG